MKAKLLNYVLGAVIVIEDDEGNIVEKRQMDPVEAFNEDQVIDFMAKVREQTRTLSE